jgi:alkaline phosphatase D
MPIAIRAGQSLNRRQWLVRSAATCAVAGLGSLARPYLSRAADRPLITSGIQSGDVSAESAVVWARADRAARMQVECSTAEDFKTIIGAASADALPASDFTSKVLLGGLPSGQDIFYRVRFEDIDGQGLAGEAQIGHFRTAPTAKSNVSFAWSGDTTGQGWGIDESRGGMRTYRTMLDNRPDFFIHSGDHIYADCPVERELKLPDGGVWRNIVTEEKSVVAHSLAQFRGNYKYNWLDQNFRALPPCPCSRSGTTTRSPTTGRRSAPPMRPAMPRTAPRFWWRGPAAHSMNSCRCARDLRRRTAVSIARSPTARCSTSS